MILITRDQITALKGN